MEQNNSQDELDSWEDLDDQEVLERKLNEIISRRDKQKAVYNGNTGPVKIVGEDEFRSHYVPPEPTVKILKRPTNDVSDSQSDLKHKQQPKTLQQREQEYAEARLRILGESNHTPDDSSSDDYSGSPVWVHPRILSSNSSKNVMTSALDVNLESSTVALGTSELKGIIRLPRGPDETNGFHIRR